ncbi:MAG: ABC transporter ATP-binding protein [Inquilinus sp.]|nr:ABC transporter ATP-binding protein [Inquilinus sp.]
MNGLDINVRRKIYAARNGSPGPAALSGLEFHIPEGQLVCLVGPSGCGKTTLLNLIGGLDSDFDGEIAFDAAPADRRIGYMFQTPRLMPWLTVLDNVRLVLDDETDAAARRLLVEMELGDVLDAYPSQLSGGMQRRVALARAFAIEPQLLLLDEPFVSLDAPIADRLRTALLDLWKSRPTTVLFVTHDLREALCLADRIVFLSAGPGRVVHEMPVLLPRPRHADDAAVEAARRRLLAERPGLLAGLDTAADSAGPDRHRAVP